jgi:phosphatidylglycerophosphate synthase
MLKNETAPVIVLPFGNKITEIGYFQLPILRRIGVTLTYTRAPLAGAVVFIGLMGDWLLAALLLVLFALLDFLDGRFARFGGVQDTAWRRMVDAIIDKLAAHLCFLVIAMQIPSILWVWPLVFLRDLIQGNTALKLVLNRRVVVAGAWWHRFFTLSEIIWLCCAFAFHNDFIPLGIPVIFFGFATLHDYRKQCLAILGQSTYFLKPSVAN